MDYSSLSTDIRVTTSVVQKTIPSISGKKNILFIPKINTTIRGSFEIPYSVFKNGDDCYIPVVGSTTGYFCVTYVSDTSIKVSANNSQFNYVDIYVNS